MRAWLCLLMLLVGCAKEPKTPVEVPVGEVPLIAQSNSVIRIEHLEIKLVGVWTKDFADRTGTYTDCSVVNFSIVNVSRTSIVRLHLPLLVSFNRLPFDQHGNWYYQLNRKSKAPRWDEVILHPGDRTQANVVIDKLIDVPDLYLTVVFNKEIFGLPVKFHVKPECIHHREQ